MINGNGGRLESTEVGESRRKSRTGWWWCALALTVTSVRASGQTLVMSMDGAVPNVRYEKTVDSTVVSVWAQVYRVDGAPEPPMQTALGTWFITLRTAFKGKEASGRPGAIIAEFREFAVYPEPLPHALSIAIDSLEPIRVPAYWLCRPVYPIAAGAQMEFTLWWAAIRRLGSARQLLIRVGAMEFQVDPLGIEKIKNFAAFLPPDTAEGAQTAKLDSSARTSPLPAIAYRAPSAKKGNVLPSAVLRGHHATADTLLYSVVIDTLGVPEMRTFRIVSATDSTYRDAVLQALPSWRFEPAITCGEKTRHVVSQYIVFQP